MIIEVRRLYVAFPYILHHSFRFISWKIIFFNNCDHNFHDVYIFYFMKDTCLLYNILNMNFMWLSWRIIYPIIKIYQEMVDDFSFFDCSMFNFVFCYGEGWMTCHFWLFNVQFCFLLRGRVDDLSFFDYLSPFCFLLRGRVDDLSFFDYLSPFCFLSIEFHCTFSYYHILFIIIVFWLGCDRPSGHIFFVPALFFSILMPLFLPP